MVADAPAPPVRVTALYRFVPLPDPAALRLALEGLCRSSGLRGTLILAGEGINGTVAGDAAAVERLLEVVRALPGGGEAMVREASSPTVPFHRLKVRLKHEIVTMGEPGLDPLADAGRRVAPAEWNALVDDPATVVIDTRNAYEVAAGSFAGAVDPGTDGFRDFPAWVRANRARLDGAARVAMFCTGGIRCEKATAFLKAEGVADVVHLKGGILAYLAEVPEADSRWQGECFVFDERVAIGHGLRPGSHVLCRGCRMPVDAAGQASPLFEPGVACARCAPTRSERQRRGYAERHRQSGLAAARGRAHVGTPDRAAR